MGHSGPSSEKTELGAAVSTLCPLALTCSLGWPYNLTHIPATYATVGHCWLQETERGRGVVTQRWRGKGRFVCLPANAAHATHLAARRLAGAIEKAAAAACWLAC